MLRHLLTATLNLLFFRAGPQDFPFDPGLTRLMVPAATLANYAVLVIVLPPVLALVMALAVVTAMGFSTRMLLRARKLEERFVQTYHALLAASTVMTLALWLPFSEVAPALIELSTDPNAADKAATLQLPAGPVFLMNALNVWNFAVNASIFRHAANLNLAAGILVALVVAMSILLFVVFVASVVAALIGAPAS